MALRILVAGAGALGSVFGGYLAAAGNQVTLLGRSPHLAAVAAGGLALEGLWGARLVRGLSTALDPAGLSPPFDAILLTVKSYDTAAMLAHTAPLLDAGGCLLSLQNGLGNVESAAAAVGPDRALGGRVIFGAEIPRPGVARVTVFAEPVAIGAACPGTATAETRARAWAARIADAGVPAEYTYDIHVYLWAKVLYNAALNPLGALFNLPYGALGDDPDARALMDAVIDEGHAVACARGVVPLTTTAEDYRRLFYDRLLPATVDHRSSMLQDIERGRATEIEAINGRIWAYGKEAGIETPVNAAMTRLVRWRVRLAGTVVQTQC